MAAHAPAAAKRARRPVAAASAAVAPGSASRLARLLERIPALAVSGDDQAVDLILYEVLRLLVEEVRADVGQINLLPKGGRVEKVCILKDGRPWLRKDMGLHLFDPLHGFTGQVLARGESVRVEDIWARGTAADPNPFLEVVSTMNERYVREIKKPVASILISPIKRGRDIFCTIELARYRSRRRPFGEPERELVDGFGRELGTFLIDYIVDVKSRIAVHTAHRKLLSLSRLIASNKPVEYRDAVDAYMRLSAADIGLALFQTGELTESSYRTLMWQGEEVREILLKDFAPSADSILRADASIPLPVEGEEGDARLGQFRRRMETFPGLSADDRRFVLSCLAAVRSYVAYPLHLLGQDLGAIVLGSRRARFWEFLHMNPFLDLYNSLLKSFLLNERVIHCLSNVSLKVHNPGFYCLGELKAALAVKHPAAFQDPGIRRALDGLGGLFAELHDQGKALRSREKRIHLSKWLQAFVGQKAALLSGLQIRVEAEGDGLADCMSRARDEQLETIFENLFSNSLRAIGARRNQDPSFVGSIVVRLRREQARVRILFQDNGVPYATVSGRGLAQLRDEMRNLGGALRTYRDPYRAVLCFPCIENAKARRRETDEGESPLLRRHLQ
ncbi:MAG: GAF domain-containing protein [bacterium]